MAPIFNRSSYILFYILTLLLDMSFAGSLYAFIKDISPYNVVKNFTTYTYAECGLSCDEYKGCDEIYVNETGDDLIQCLLLSNKTINGLKEKCVKKDVNIALNKPSKVSKEKNDRPASQVNDGDLATYGSSGKEVTRNSWWEVDLERIVSLKSIKIFMRQSDLDNGFYIRLNIAARTTSTGTWAMCTVVKSPKEAIHQTTCDASTRARFVRITMVQNDRYLALSEVEIFEWK